MKYCSFFIEKALQECNKKKPRTIIHGSNIPTSMAIISLIKFRDEPRHFTNLLVKFWLVYQTKNFKIRIQKISNPNPFSGNGLSIFMASFDRRKIDSIKKSIDLMDVTGSIDKKKTCQNSHGPLQLHSHPPPFRIYCNFHEISK